MSREPEILKSIIDDTEYNKTPQSRNEEILLSILNDTEYTKTPQSREEELLLELKDKIGHGITVEPLSVTENGTYTAPAGTAYSPVEVNITPPQLVKRVTGNPVEFSDGADAPVVKCVTQITGSQDLHGYDKPWVGGAGKNIIDNSISAWETGAINSSGQNASSDSQKRTIGKFAIRGGQSIVISGISIPSTSSDVRFFWYASDDSFIDYKNFNVQSFVIPEGVAYFRMRTPLNLDLSALQIEYGDSATTYEPYSNICPITAYTEGEIEVRGKNLFDKDNADILTGRALNPQTGEVYVTSNWSVSNYIKIEPSTTYTLNTMPSGSNSVAFYDSEKAYISGYGSFGTKTTPSNAKYVKFDYRTEYLSIMQLEKGSTATAYEPYTSTTHTTTFPSAIYRGSEDVVNGEVTSETPVIDLGDLTWELWPNRAHLFRASLVSNMALVVNEQKAPWMCSNYEVETGVNVASEINGLIGMIHKAYIIICDTRYSDATAFTTAINGVQLAYELATPTTSSVTPTNLPLKTLFGYNHIESSTGEMVLDYITDKYQNFVDTVNRAVPSTRKSGSGAMEVFMSLEKYEDSEQDPEDVKGESR